jgi:hypothetical protein
MTADETFVGLDGYRCTFSQSPMGAALIQAIAALPGAETLDENQIEQKARFIWTQAQWARQDALKRNRPASQSASDKELRDLHKLCGKLADHIEGMHAPAVTALANEGFLALPMAEKLREMMEGARYAFGACEGQPARGQPRKIEASQIREIAGLVYQDVADKRLTRTIGTLSHEVSGAWPEFLEAVFGALNIDASVANQSRPT